MTWAGIEPEFVQEGSNLLAIKAAPLPPGANHLQLNFASSKLWR